MCSMACLHSYPIWFCGYGVQLWHIHLSTLHYTSKYQSSKWLGHWKQSVLHKIFFVEIKLVYWSFKHSRYFWWFPESSCVSSHVSWFKSQQIGDSFMPPTWMSVRLLQWLAVRGLVISDSCKALSSQHARCAIIQHVPDWILESCCPVLSW